MLNNSNLLSLKHFKVDRTFHLQALLMGKRGQKGQLLGGLVSKGAEGTVAWGLGL